MEAGLVAVLRLDARGRLLGSTVMARGDVAGFTGLEVSPAGEVYVAGHAGAAGRSSGFLSRLGPTLDLVWSSDALGEGEPPLVKDFLRGPDGLLHLAGSVGTGSSSDAWTAAFDASGVRVREIRRDGGRDDGAAALAIDPAGNIHVTGSSFGRNSPDLLTVSYGPDGRERWAARYLRPERTQIHRVLADGESALVAGGSGRYGDLIRYGAGGEVQWDLTFRLEDGFDLALDPGGDVLLAAGALQRIDPAGVRLWTRGEPPSYEKVQVDAVGSIYAAGFERNERGVRQPTLAKLDPSGTEVWRKVLFLEGSVQGLALDPAGLPIFTDARNRTVFKYDAAGEVIWSTKLPDRFTGVRVAADASGAVYVGGNGVVKLDPAGNHLWGEPTSNVWRDMLLVPAGRVYAIDSQHALLELTPDGSEVWRSSELGWIERIFLDASGGLYVSGANPGMDRPDTYFVSRIEPGGRVADRIEFGPARFGPGQPVLGFLSSGDLIAAAPSEERYAIIRLRTVPGAEFVRGDANEDGRVLMDDAIGTLDWLFRGGSAPACPDASDVNDDGRNDISDPIYTLTHLFLGGPAPPAPHPGKGPDPSLDSLGCSG